MISEDPQSQEARRPQLPLLPTSLSVPSTLVAFVNPRLHRTVADRFPGHRVGVRCRECHLFVSVPMDVMDVNHFLFYKE